MEPDWAEEHLQTIRTLMERSALYRRAQGPIMLFVGALGVLGGGGGVLFRIDSPRSFILFWWGVACLALAGAFLLVRRQALRDAEPFWSPPTRRVVQAMLPPLTAGFLAGLYALAWTARSAAPFNLMWLALVWVALYGCALHGAGFFMPRGVKVVGWIFVIAAGALLMILPLPGPQPTGSLGLAHMIMGAFFGALHVLYGTYLYMTKEGMNAA